MEKVSQKIEDVVQNTFNRLEIQFTKQELEKRDLRQNISHLQCAFDNLPAIAAIIGTDYRFIRCNLSFCNFLGYEEYELIGKPISHITYPEDIENGISELIAGSASVFTLKKRFLKKDGSLVWGEITMTMALGSNNRPLYFLPVINNINDREISEKRLIKSEERYKRITEGLTDYLYTVIIKNGKAIKTLHNDACKSVTGYSPKEFRKDQFLWLNMVVPEDRELVSERVSSIISGDYIPTIELRIIHKDGTIRWISDTAIPKYDSDGILVSYDGVIKNIGTKKLAETYGEIFRDILQVQKDPLDIPAFLSRIAYIIKEKTGFDNVGIRLKEANDFPYIAHTGFSKDYLKTENSIVSNKPDNNSLYSNNEIITLDCKCGQVLSGKIEKNNPSFTKGGSWWTNTESEKSSSELKLFTRDTCLKNCYVSLALIPIKAIEKNIGLIQLCDRSKGRFSLETVEILEVIASHIGMSLMLKQAESKFTESEKQFKKIVKARSVHYS
jgi:PAS domain S-box-containing protein